MLIKPEAEKYLDIGLDYITDKERWANPIYKRAYEKFCLANGKCRPKQFDVAVAQVRHMKSGERNFRGQGRHGKWMATHTTSMNPDAASKAGFTMNKTGGSNAFREALERGGHNVS